MNVALEQLLQIIGELYVENVLLKNKLALLEQAKDAPTQGE